MDIPRQRLVNQGLLHPTTNDPAAVVARLGAVQAQDYAGAKWALGLRMRNIHDEDVERAFDAGKMLRTHILRPTWHFVAPADIRWMLELSAPRVHVTNAFMYRKLELDDALFKRSHTVFVKSLQGGKQKTRNELGAALERAGIHADGQRLGYIVMHAELDGILVSGARRGKQFTYALLDERAPQAKTLPREEALYELTRRYFATRGPATLQDFVWWSGLTLTDARRGIEMCRAEFASARIGKQTYWFPETTPPPARSAPVAHWLPNYDEYFIGFRDRSALLAAPPPKEFDGRGNILFNHVIALDGLLVGSWRRTVRGKTVVLETDFTVPLDNAAQRAIAAAAKQYGAFLKLEVVMQDAQPRERL